MKLLIPFLVVFSIFIGTISAYPSSQWFSQALKYKPVDRATVLSMNKNLDQSFNQESSGNSFSAPAQQLTRQQMNSFMAPVQQQQSSYSAPAPQPQVVQQSSGYSAPAPQPQVVQQSNGYSAPAPQPQVVQQSSGYSAPAPQPQVVQQSSGYSAPAPQPQVVQQSNGYSAPAQQIVQQSSGYSAPAPQVMQQSSGYSAQAPQPVQTFLTQSSNSYQQPSIQQSVGGYDAPVQSGRLFQENPCSPNPCKNEGVCTVVGNSFQCSCPWGWKGLRCEECLTECASNPCSKNKICKAKFGGGYECVCPANRVGENCEIQNDLCSNNPCLNGGICSPLEGGSFTCVCKQPWAGQRCDKLWQNPCTEETMRNSEVMQFKDPWDKHSYLICVDINKYHSMPCSVGTYFNENLHHCVPEGYDPPVCPSRFCYNDGECLVDEYNLLKCVCKKGFSGERCEVNIDECLIEGNANCMGGQCVDQVNGYFCRCPNGGVGLSCRETIQDPCTAQNLAADNHYHELPSVNRNVFLHCTSENSFVVHRCADNLYWHPEERTCSIERPPLKTGLCAALPCKNGGECVESGYSGFSCVCKSGYTGVTCEQMIDFCLSNPCLNGGRCLSYAGGYTCVCPDKVIDDCCCNGLTNPCPPKSRLVPGVNNYFPHLFANKYIHCDFDGRAFVRSCAPTTKWNQGVLSCLPDNFVLNNTYDQVNSYGTQAYGYNMGNKVESKPTLTQSFNSYSAQAPVEIVQQSNSYSAPAPVQQQSSYSAPAPVQQQSGYSAPAPVQQQSGYSAPAPVQQQSSYSAPAPVQQQQQSSYSAPVETVEQQSSYSAPAPVQQQSGYSAPAPAPVQQQQQSSYSAPAPAPVQQQQQSSYSAPAPVQQQSGYSAPAPAPVQQQQQSSYSAPAPALVQQQQSSYSAPAPAPVQQQQQSSYSAPAPVQQQQSSYSAPAPVQQQQQSSYSAPAPAPVQQQQSSYSASSPAQQITQQSQNSYSAQQQAPIQQVRTFEIPQPQMPQPQPQLQFSHEQIKQLLNAGIQLPDSLLRQYSGNVQKLSARNPFYGYY